MSPMEQWLEWARGPLFRACFAIMLLGLVRVVLLNALGIASIMRKSRQNSRSVAWKLVLTASLQWLLPIRKGFEARAVFSFTSMLFHLSIVITPVFLGAHIVLWERGLGISWPALSSAASDYLTLLGIVTGIALFVQRVGARASRALSRAQDYILPVLLVVPFATGYLAMHPSINPFGYNGTMLVHIISANLIFLLIPFSKLSHVSLFPLTQLVSELGWHLQPGSGQQVAVILGKENEPI